VLLVHRDELTILGLKVKDAKDHSVAYEPASKIRKIEEEEEEEEEGSEEEEEEDEDFQTKTKKGGKLTETDRVLEFKSL
jgi:hypothetical protein